jgi:hypothetical protein
MPSLSLMQASVPRCDRAIGPGGVVTMCDRPMRWIAEPPAAWIKTESGVWSCPKHGPVMDGHEAAARAGYVAERIVVEA